jgi:hypothetical protein
MKYNDVPIYKVGKTTDIQRRMKEYSNDFKVVYVEEVFNSTLVESMVLRSFCEHFERVFCNEFFIILSQDHAITIITENAKEEVHLFNDYIKTKKANNKDTINVEEKVKHIDSAKNDTLMEMIKSKSLLECAKIFYNTYPTEYIFDPNVSHWYEKIDGLYKNSQSNPSVLQTSLYNNLPTLLKQLGENLDINKKRDLDKFILHVKKDSSVKSLVKNLKSMYERKISQQNFTKLKLSLCPTYQWIITNVFVDKTSVDDNGCKQLYDKFLLDTKPYFPKLQELSIIEFMSKVRGYYWDLLIE